MAAQECIKQKQKDQLFQLAEGPRHIYAAAEAGSKREGQERGMLSPRRGSVHVQNLPGEPFLAQALGFPSSWAPDSRSKASQLEASQVSF